MTLRKFVVLGGLFAFSSRAEAQSLLDRSPNLSGDWVGAPGTLYFHFVHRFTVSDAPQRKVSNVPTFLVAAGLPKRLLAGFNYSTNSTLAPNFPPAGPLLQKILEDRSILAARSDITTQPMESTEKFPRQNDLAGFAWF